MPNPTAHGTAPRRTWLTGGGLSVVLIILWPLLALPAGTFSKGYFTLWVAIALAWGLAASVTCIFAPLWESRDHISKIFSGLCGGAPPDAGKAAAFYDDGDAKAGALPTSAAAPDASVEFDRPAARKAADY
jgi:hypothetical protein